MSQYWSLLHQIKQIDPSFIDYELLPPDGIAGLTWQGREAIAGAGHRHRDGWISSGQD
jgi:hypothetical protein